MEHTGAEPRLSAYLHARACAKGIPLAGTFELTARCNFNCRMCYVHLTPEEQRRRGAELTADEWLAIAEQARSQGMLFLLLTGGEPLLQPHIGELITALGALGYRVEIETNGSVALEPFAALAFRPCFTMDYKLPDSGMESAMKPENFDLLRSQDAVKFVVGSRSDLNRALEVIRQYALTAKCTVFFSPVFGAIEPVEIVEFLEEHKLNRVRLQLQLHKLIWDPQKRGV